MARLDLMLADLAATGGERWRGLAVESERAVYTARLIAAADDAAIALHDDRLAAGERCDCDLCEALAIAGDSRMLAVESYAASYAR